MSFNYFENSFEFSFLLHKSQLQNIILSTLVWGIRDASLGFGPDWAKTPGGGGALPINGLMGMCRWMGSHFHDRTDYNGAAFSSTFYRVTRMGSHFSGILRVRKFWQVVIYKRKDSPKRKSYRIHCCCLIFDKRLPLRD